MYLCVCACARSRARACIHLIVDLSQKIKICFIENAPGVPIWLTFVLGKALVQLSRSKGLNGIVYFTI